MFPIGFLSPSFMISSLPPPSHSLLQPLSIYRWILSSQSISSTLPLPLSITHTHTHTHIPRCEISALQQPNLKIDSSYAFHGRITSCCPPSFSLPHLSRPTTPTPPRFLSLHPLPLLPLPLSLFFRSASVLSHQHIVIKLTPTHTHTLNSKHTQHLKYTTSQIHTHLTTNTHTRSNTQHLKYTLT